MKLLCWWFQRWKKNHFFILKIKHGPFLYWLIWNFEKNKFWLHKRIWKIICSIAHLFFYIFIRNHHIYCSTSTWPQTLHRSLKILKCIEKGSNILVSFKCIHLPLKYFNIHHSYILMSIKSPSKYIVTTSLHIFGVRYNTIYFNMLPYILKLSCNLSILHIFVLSLYYFSKFSWHLIILQKCPCTLTYFLELNKSGIFHELYKLYWSFKYLNFWLTL